MFQLNPRTEPVGPQASLANKQASKQNVRLLIALSLLLVTLAVILIEDRNFWFGSDEVFATNVSASENVARAESAAAKTVQTPATQVATARHHSAAKTLSSSAQPALTQDAAATSAPVVATNRVALPPMDVEVVAGDSHRTVHPGSNVKKVEILNDSSRAPQMASLPADAAERESLTAAVPELRQSVDAIYPTLGDHSKVQGSVVLQAIVGADGTIENLHVVSGPAILITAAQQAVREWHFKPYLQNGRPVETKARITVNFSIRVSDSASAS
ncbi:MAG: energy transducer TonB [Candidatus Sulfotelmatobacter sp.]